MSRPAAFEVLAQVHPLDGNILICHPIHPFTKQRLTFRSFIDFLVDPTFFGQQFKLELTKFLVERNLDFFFECPPITTDEYLRDSTEFEFTLVGTKQFDNVNLDPGAFREKFETIDGDIIVFPNLSGDTQLVCPRQLQSPDISPNAYIHFANFLRYGDKAQIVDLWRRIGAEMRQLLTSRSSEKIYLSTHGGGVNYLHVRLSKTPKYYHVKQYAL